MTPTFVRRTRARFEPSVATELPPPLPPLRDPAEEWNTLRTYAAKVAEVAATTAEANRNLIAENAALHRRIEHLEVQNAEVLRENRIAQSYAQSLRTRVTTIREALQTAENESLQFASNSVRERVAPTPEENAAGEEVQEVLSRIQPSGQSGGTTALAPNRF